MKRKYANDNSGLLPGANSSSVPWSNAESKYAKCQRYGIGLEETTARICGNDSSGSQTTHPLIYQPALYPSGVTETNVPCSRHKRRKRPCTGGKPPVGAVSLEQKRCKETMNITDRKRHFIYTRDDSMKDRMKKYVNDVYRLFDDSRSEDNCWLHPSPPLRSNGRPAGSIQCELKWNDSSGSHALRVNFGIVALIINHHLTGAQMQGIVNNAWHLSHLCGNWTCCNWRHMTVESAGINIGRNACFPVTTPCSHDPPCMKDRKRQLLVTVDISDQIKRAIKWTRIGAKLTPGCQIIFSTPSGFDCGICGDGVYCRNYMICSSLTSITKSQKALEKLELCSHPNEDILKAIAHLKWIIADLIREKEASDATFLHRAVARRKLDDLIRLRSKYDQMIANLLG